MFECQCCKILRDENAHLRGLIDRMMAQIAPKDEPIDNRIQTEIDGTTDSISFGG